MQGLIVKQRRGQCDLLLRRVLLRARAPSLRHGCCCEPQGAMQHTECDVQTTTRFVNSRLLALLKASV